MAFLSESSVWETGVYQIETHDDVIGGPTGISNLQAKALANRTVYLKGRVDSGDAALAAHVAAADPHAQYLRQVEGDARYALQATTLAGYGITDGLQVPNLRSGTDLDSHVMTAWFSGYNFVHAPLDSTAYWYIAVQEHGGSGTYCVQQATRVTGTYPETWRRRQNGAGGWSEWVMVLDTYNSGDAAQRDVGTGAGQLPAIEDTDARYLRIEPGMVAAFARNVAPSGWLKCNGAAVSRTTYAALFAAISTTFGDGNGSTTFNVPDLRGEFVRGWDDGRGVDTGRAFGGFQAAALAQHTHPFPLVAQGYGALSGVALLTGSVSNGGNLDTQNNAGTETRPRNVALLLCIKY